MTAQRLEFASIAKGKACRGVQRASSLRRQLHFKLCIHFAQCRELA